MPRPNGTPTSAYQPQLIDATFALLLSASGDPMVIPALNRDGDILSDLVLPLFGSIAGSESLVVAFGDDYVPKVVLAEAAHGTAPSPLRQERRQPPGDDPRRVSRALVRRDRRDCRGRKSDTRGKPRSDCGRRTGPPISPDTRRRRSSRTKSSAASGRSWTYGPPSRRAWRFDPLRLEREAAVAASRPRHAC